jgi:hypothetical protein
MQQSVLSLKVKATGPGLGFRLKFDDTVVYDASPGTDPITVTHEFDDTKEQQHLVTLEMHGKKPEHTEVDDNGEITADRVIEISHITMDGIDVDYMFTQQAVYHHDFNGHGASTTDSFFGCMGCNGRVEFQFASPLYLWLLENL